MSVCGTKIHRERIKTKLWIMIIRLSQVVQVRDNFFLSAKECVVPNWNDKYKSVKRRLVPSSDSRGKSIANARRVVPE